MPSSVSILAPFLLLLPVSGGGEAAASDGRGAPDEAAFIEEGAGPLVTRIVAGAWRQEPAYQVRIERHATIRVSPRAAPAMPPSMFVQIPRAPMEPRYLERRMGKCLPMSGIAGVQAESGDRLLLFMRDRRIVSAELERACRARDFYSGFYLAPSDDGQLCVDRDALQSRNGANCRLTRIRQLIFLDD